MSEPRGMLIDPLGPAEALTRDEHKLLKTVLRISRDPDDRGRAFYQQLYSLTFFFGQEKGPNTEAEIIHKLNGFFLLEHENRSDFHDGAGMLAGHRDEHFFTLDAEELWTLVHTLTALRIGGWFSKWLMIQVACIAKAIRPEEKCPAPLFIAGTLTEAIDEWNTEEAQAKAFAERRPDLLFPAPPAEPQAAAEPATDKPAKAPRARKRHSRKAS